jgi:hypothetical protein
MPATQSYLEAAERYSARNYHPLPVVLERGDGVWMWDVEGRRYLDMLSAYSALNQGHRHPRIIQALIDQAQRLTLTSRAFHNDQMGPFLAELCELLGYEKALPMNTGAEAVETAIKAARLWGYEQKGVPDGEAQEPAGDIDSASPARVAALAADIVPEPEPLFEGHRQFQENQRGVSYETLLLPYLDQAPLYNLYHLLNHLNLFGGGYLAQVEATLCLLRLA